MDFVLTVLLSKASDSELEQYKNVYIGLAEVLRQFWQEKLNKGDKHKCKKFLEMVEKFRDVHIKNLRSCFANELDRLISTARQSLET